MISHVLVPRTHASLSSAFRRVTQKRWKIAIPQVTIHIPSDTPIGPRTWPHPIPFPPLPPFPSDRPPTFSPDTNNILVAKIIQFPLLWNKFATTTTRSLGVGAPSCQARNCVDTTTFDYMMNKRKWQFRKHRPFVCIPSAHYYHPTCLP